MLPSCLRAFVVALLQIVAITFNSTAIGVGRQFTSTVVCRPALGEMFGIQLVEGREIILHIRQKNGDIDDVGPR